MNRDTATVPELVEVNSGDWSEGNKNAKVTLIEYLDFECPTCAAYYPLMKELKEEFKDDVLFINRYFPLSGHINGMSSAIAVEAAGRQGKYWEMHNIVFEKQREWGGKSVINTAIFEEYAKEIGLDVEKFKSDVKLSEVREKVNKDRNSGQSLGVTGTPTFFLNGVKIVNPQTIEDFRIQLNAAILNSPKIELGEKVHEHADFKVFLNGKSFDFTKDKYQSSVDNPLDPEAHLHDGIGHVIHKHRKGVTLEYFFETLNMRFSNNCFVTDDGTEYCNNDKNTLKFIVNGKENDKFETYEFSDLDKIIISYGPKDENLDNQINSISDDACLYSEKCPERGKPPTENCVGGLGTDC